MSDTSTETEEVFTEAFRGGPFPVDVTPSPPSEVEKEPCPECGEPYVKGAGMTRHRRMKHGVGDPQRITCQEPGCGARLSKKNYGRHLRETHGKRGGISGKVRNKPKPKPVPQELVSEVDDLTAEQIVGTVVHMLWPESMPTTQMPLVMKYYGQTADFLRAVRNGPSS
jgi:hypothetical protein